VFQIDQRYDIAVYSCFKSTDGTILQSIRISIRPTVRTCSLLVFQIDRRYELAVHSHLNSTDGTNLQSTRVSNRPTVRYCSLLVFQIDQLNKPDDTLLQFNSASSNPTIRYFSKTLPHSNRQYDIALIWRIQFNRRYAIAVEATIRYHTTDVYGTTHKYHWCWSVNRNNTTGYLLKAVESCFAHPEKKVVTFCERWSVTKRELFSRR